MDSPARDQCASCLEFVEGEMRLPRTTMSNCVPIGIVSPRRTLRNFL